MLECAIYTRLSICALSLSDKHLFTDAGLYLSLQVRPVALKRTFGVGEVPFPGISLLFCLAKCLVKVLLPLPPAIHLIRRFRV